MLKQSNNRNDIKKIIEYIGNAYKKTPYLYANIVKYGLKSSSVVSGVDVDTNGHISGCYLQYYDCLHFFSNDYSDQTYNVLTELINRSSVNVIMISGAIERFEKTGNELLANYEVEKNHVIDMDSIGNEPIVYAGEVAKESDLVEIAKLVCMSPIYQNIYTIDTLVKQYLERFKDKYSRFFIERDIQGNIAAACSTYGEVRNFALVGGVIVHPEYRRQGLGSKVESFACNVLEKEGISRVGFVNYDNLPSLKFHEKLGAFPIATLYKYIKLSN